jgi:hypothetical protein
MTNERWLRWAIARYYRSRGYKVTMKPARVGNAMVDGVAVGLEGEGIATEQIAKRPYRSWDRTVLRGVR